MNTLVSVIVPIYNADAYLHTCLQSIAEQTYPHLQVILVNDGSTDHSADIAQHFVDTDPRFMLISQHNQGLSATRNTAMQRARGELLSFVDADDYLAPDFYQQAVQHIGNADVLQLGFLKVNVAGQPIATRYPLFLYQFTSACCRVYRKDFLTQHQLQFPIGYIYEDVLFSIDLWLAHPQIQYLRYAGYCYRTNPTSITSHRHDTRPLFRLIGEKQRTRQLTCKEHLLLLYTRLRLRLHFLLNK